MTLSDQKSPELGSRLRIGGYEVNYHDAGAGRPVLMVHGSGPGVTAWANWRGVIPKLSENHRVIAPDMLGFGYTSCAPDLRLDLDAWVNQVIELLDTLGLESVDMVGNSFGGAVALAVAHRFPERVNRLVLMGAVGLSFPLTAGLDKVWGYQPSMQAMGELLRIFAYDHSIITEDLVQMRYAASVRDDVQKRFSLLFPEPRQAGIEMLALGEDALRSIRQQTLILHGRNDQVIPVEVSERMAQLIPNCDLNVFGRCGHWVQIERAADFLEALRRFLAKR